MDMCGLNYHMVDFQALDEMVSEFESANITQKATETFRGTGADLRSKMNDLKVSGLRVMLQRMRTCTLYVVIVFPRSG